MKAFMLIVACLAMSGCIALGRSSIPPYPPTLSPDYYNARLQQIKATNHDPVCAIAGARLAAHGIYIDLLFLNIPPMPGEDPIVHQGPNTEWSTLEDPGRLIELRDETDQLILLCPWQYPEPTRIYLPEPEPSFRDDLPFKLIDESGTMSYLGVCMFRTERQLKPGMYKITLISYPRTNFDFGAGRSWREMKLVVDTASLGVELKSLHF